LAAAESFSSYLKKRQQATQKALALLKLLSTDKEKTDLLNVRNCYPAEISGGQRQRAAVAQQVLCSEHFLMMDEPTAGLDPVSKFQVCDLVTELANSGDGITVILVTHDISTACAIADTIWLMGRDTDQNGNTIPGARIVDTYDLIECGLTWNPNVRSHPAYAPLVRELNERFKSL
jgi:polar amino acid transport system ATP-binding protein/sulfate transport system ATP-binding protein